MHRAKLAFGSEKCRKNSFTISRSTKGQPSGPRIRTPWGRLQREKHCLDNVAKALIQYETLSGDEISQILKGKEINKII